MSHKTVRLHPVDVAFVASSVQLHNIFVTSLPKLRTDGITDPTDGLLNQFDHSYGVVVAEYNARTVLLLLVLMMCMDGRRKYGDTNALARTRDGAIAS